MTRAKRDPRIQAIVARLTSDPDMLTRIEVLLEHMDAPCPQYIHGAADAYSTFHPRMAGLDHEELHALYLNRRNAVLACFTITSGNDAHCIVDPKQVLREAVRLGAGAVILAHNHPSGDAAPSLADVEVTQRMEQAARLLGIDLLDHIIVTDDSYRSMREDGLVPSRTGSQAFCTSGR
ncbi:MAG: JAB domain-containing protein [Phycisphaerae bacterium]|jgi:DNA repair protein RadC